ncbi:MAG: DUF981 family protein [Thermoproteus sp.]
MDPLDLWLDVLGTTLLATAYWLYLNFASKASLAVKLAFNKAFGYFYIALGVYALASGLWATATWPLPSSYNLIFFRRLADLRRGADTPWPHEQ